MKCFIVMYSFNMVQFKLQLLVFALVFFAVADAIADGETPIFVAFKPLIFVANGDGTYSAQYNGLSYSLRDPDDIKNPQIWDSALSITTANSSSTCSTDSLLIQRVYASQDAVLVVHFSGSTTFLDLIATANCQLLAPRFEAMTEKIVVQDTRVEIWPGCEPIDANISNCSAAKVFRLDNKFARIDLPKASDTLTRQVVGIAFRGIKKVRHAKSGKAALAK